jgi:hypothetical protein
MANVKPMDYRIYLSETIWSFRFKERPHALKIERI